MIKTALITGGSNGIGKAIAQKLAKENIEVINADTEEQEAGPENLVYRKCDVTNGEDIDALYAWLYEKQALPDVLVLNAGTGIHEKLLEGDPEKWKNTIDLNVMGILRCIRAFVPHMQEKKHGRVIFISSVAAFKPYEYGGVYSASKAALEMIAETLWLETQPYIAVTTINAGITDTGFFKGRLLKDQTVADLGMGSLLPQNIADDVWHVLSKRDGAVINRIITRPAQQLF
ncbi:SDR family oxidoreductase [Flavobacterium sp. MK4S-17]|uniref:SDR family oxidoreductase n=1 Tax=Flavobacterium sp. MK4S-17 TaxID=2543737 RepID=UPI00135C9D91|nr:SDR family oxidoreductase [Flavobacterium sp. MK4S-17]